MGRREMIVVGRNLTKAYGLSVAVDKVSFEVRPGECLGLLGPNGAGKTTLVRMVHCFFAPSSGQLTVFGLPVEKASREIKSSLGVVPQDENFDPDLPVLDNLIVYARYFDLGRAEATRRAEELLRFLELSERSSSRLDQLSSGMKRRLLIARALINEPRLLLLDEPTVGLDPQVRLLIWEKLEELKGRGVTQILTTHYMDEAARLCDRVAIMDRGRIISEGKPSELVRTVGDQVIEVRAGENGVNRVRAALGKTGDRVEERGNTVFVYCEDSRSAGRKLLEAGFTEMATRPATLEDVFLEMTGRRITS